MRLHVKPKIKNILVITLERINIFDSSLLKKIFSVVRTVNLKTMILDLERKNVLAS